MIYPFWKAEIDSSLEETKENAQLIHNCFKLRQHHCLGLAAIKYQQKAVCRIIKKCLRCHPHKPCSELAQDSSPNQYMCKE
jgi:hypothetical protein